MTDLNNTTALVTGASSGLGEAIAHALAARGVDVMLVARRQDKLEAVRSAIEQQHGVRATAIVQDISTREGCEALFEQTRGTHIGILVNNAGFGLYGHFSHIDWPSTQKMLELDIISLSHLTKFYGDAMLMHGGGYIMQIASIGGFQPSPRYAAYSAAKAYVLDFSFAINHEMKDRGVTSTVVSPGVTETEFLTISGQTRNWYHKATMMSAERVAASAVKAMLARRPGHVPGIINKLVVWSARFMPRPLQAWVASLVMKTD